MFYLLKEKKKPSLAETQELFEAASLCSSLALPGRWLWHLPRAATFCSAAKAALKRLPSKRAGK